MNTLTNKAEVIAKIKPETQAQRAEKQRKIREGFYNFRHKDYNGKNMNKMFEIYLKYINEIKMTHGDFAQLCHYNTNISLADIDRLWYRVRGSYCVELQDFDMFVNKIKELVNKEIIEHAKQSRMTKIKNNVKINIDNIDIKPTIKKCGNGFIAEFEHDGQLHNAYGSTKERAISILNKQILKRKMNDFDLIGEDATELYEYVDSVVGSNR